MQTFAPITSRHGIRHFVDSEPGLFAALRISGNGEYDVTEATIIDMKLTKRLALFGKFSVGSEALYSLKISRRGKGWATSDLLMFQFGYSKWLHIHDPDRLVSSVQLRKDLLAWRSVFAKDVSYDVAFEFWINGGDEGVVGDDPWRERAVAKATATASDELKRAGKDVTLFACIDKALSFTTAARS